MFRLPNDIPSHTATPIELADFLESECIKSKHGRISISNIISPILIGSDEIDIEGVDDDYDRLQLKAEEILTEVDRRLKATNNKYPFRIRGKGIEISERDDPIYYTYCYLLFCTRFNMQTDRCADLVAWTKEAKGKLRESAIY